MEKSMAGLAFDSGLRLDYGFVALKTSVSNIWVIQRFKDMRKAFMLHENCTSLISGGIFSAVYKGHFELSMFLHDKVHFK